MTTIWCSPRRSHVPEIDELFSGMTNIFGIAYDILNAGFDKQCKDHDGTLEKVLKYAD